MPKTTPEARTAKDYLHWDHNYSCAHPYLLPAIVSLLEKLNWDGKTRRVFDLGCGSGVVAQHLSDLGYDVTGVDPSTRGIAIAQEHYPALKLHEGSCYDDLASQYGQFPALVSLEVIEHVYDPVRYAQCVHALLEPGGIALISTPYHGYWKNLALALTGAMDKHFTALQPNGHIKFWSVKTLTLLLEKAGFKVLAFKRVGRIQPLAKSMIAVAQKERTP
ncbi:MAG TPA: hypothetical protein DIU37_05650 [Opitutae bacterium]|nr:hypothetical protein [Opitutae bacterium]